MRDEGVARSCRAAVLRGRGWLRGSCRSENFVPQAATTFSRSEMISELAPCVAPVGGSRRWPSSPRSWRPGRRRGQALGLEARRGVVHGHRPPVDAEGGRRGLVTPTRARRGRLSMSLRNRGSSVLEALLDHQLFGVVGSSPRRTPPRTGCAAARLSRRAGGASCRGRSDSGVTSCTVTAGPMAGAGRRPATQAWPPRPAGPRRAG